MTNDEMETRITRLETRLTATQALLHCVLPAIDPDRNHLVLDTFRRYCGSTEAQLFQDDGPPAMMDWHLELLAEMYTALEGALKLIAAKEQKNASS